MQVQVHPYIHVYILQVHTMLLPQAQMRLRFVHGSPSYEPWSTQSTTMVEKRHEHGRAKLQTRFEIEKMCLAA